MASSLPPLSAHATQVVLCDLRRCTTQDLAHHRALLSANEKARNAALGSATLRDRDAHCRGLLRRHLALLLNTSAAALQLGAGKKGKPTLVGPAEQISFNLSHSGDYAVLAFHRSHPVGVDIEHITPTRDPLRLSRRFFSREESDALAALSPENQLDAFYQLWTLKEAYIKARGDSIFDGLQAPRFKPGALGHRLDARLDWSGAPAGEAWQFWIDTPVPGYQLAVAQREATHVVDDTAGQASITVLDSPLLA